MGILTVRDTDNTYTTTLSSNTGILIFDNGASPAQLNESGGDDTNSSRLRITAPVQLNSDLIITQEHNPSKNTGTEFAGRVSGNADITITKMGVAGFQMGEVDDQQGYFFGDVDVKEGLLRLINPNAQPTLNNFMLAESKGVYVHDGARAATRKCGSRHGAWDLTPRMPMAKRN